MLRGLLEATYGPIGWEALIYGIS